MKGKGTASKRVRRKQTNVVTAAAQLADERRAERQQEMKEQKKRKLGAPPLPNKHGVGDETEEANAEDKIKASRDRNRE